MSISKKIIKIRIGQKKVALTFDNGDKLEISPNVYTEFLLFEGKALSKKDIDEIKHRNENEKYISYAVNLASQRSYTKHKIKEKLLKKGANDEQIDEVIDVLIKYHLIDDKQYIKDFLSYADYKHFGYNKIKEELFKKGISSFYIDKIEYDEDRERKHALILLKGYEKKYLKYNYQSMKQHIYEALLRQGYLFDIASSTLEKVSPIDEKKEKALLKEDYKKLKAKYEKKLSGGELRQKITESLMTKGYRYQDIKSLKE